jgi:hypothetical protein
MKGKDTHTPTLCAALFRLRRQPAGFILLLFDVGLQLSGATDPSLRFDVQRRHLRLQGSHDGGGCSCSMHPVGIATTGAMTPEGNDRVIVTVERVGMAIFTC